MALLSSLRGWGNGLRETTVDLVSPGRRLQTLSALPQGHHVSEVSRRIANQQFRALMQNYPANVLVASVGALLWLIVIWSYRPGWGAGLWGVAAAASMMGMVLFLHFFARVKPPDDALRTWEVRCGRLNWGMGVVWGLGSFVAPQDDAVSPYLALGALLVQAGTLNLAVIYRPNISWLVVPCALVTSLALVWGGGWLSAGMAMAYLLVVALLVGLARAQNTLMTQVMVASEERLALLKDLEAQRMAAQQANETKTRFLAAVSHDLRQPMHSIALLTSALRQRSGSRADMIDQLSASVQGMSGMLSAMSEVPLCRATESDQEPVGHE